MASLAINGLRPNISIMRQISWRTSTSKSQIAGSKTPAQILGQSAQMRMSSSSTTKPNQALNSDSSLAFSTSSNSIITPYHRRPEFESVKIGPFRFRPATSSRTLQHRYLWRSSSNSLSSQNGNLAHLEQTANNNPGNASAQVSFYSALLRANFPQLVVQRYTSGQFASNPACENIYRQSLAKLQGGVVAPGEDVNAPPTAEALNAIPQAIAQQLGQPVTPVGSQSQYSRYGGAGTGAGAGAKANPVHVVLEQSWGSVLFRSTQALIKFFITAWLAYVLIQLVLELQSSFGGGRPGKKKVDEVKPEMQKTRFSDVHGCDEAKEEVQDIVDFLKAPKKFSALGGKLPKGVLLTGPPGTGKTLLAKAVAGEAGVPFFYMSGSEFDEVYVGVGAKRIRELFEAARKKAPAIIFLDELDAIGARRNDRDQAYIKQTLNQLLTELDGFTPSNEVVILAATNYPQLLDKALTRPGRFDRQIAVELPDVRGRVAILKHYMGKINTATGIDPTVLARGTPGFSGADLSNLTNLAAIRASKRGARQIELSDFEFAKDRIIMGAERKSMFIQQKDKIMTAFHEGGHALVAMFTPYADPLYKATIMPRGHALGLTQTLPEMDRVSMAQREYAAKMDVCMGGKVAEELVYGLDATTSGASSDLENATSIAYQMVTRMGMSPRLGNVDLYSNYKDLPEETKQLIWEEVRRLVEESKTRAERIIKGRRKELDRLANALVEYETLGREDMEKVVRGEKLPEMLKGRASIPIKMPEETRPSAVPPPPMFPPVDEPGTPIDTTPHLPPVPESDDPERPPQPAAGAERRR